MNFPRISLITRMPKRTYPLNTRSDPKISEAGNSFVHVRSVFRGHHLLMKRSVISAPSAVETEKNLNFARYLAPDSTQYITEGRLLQLGLQAELDL
jgi:hypothetical protein